MAAPFAVSSSRREEAAFWVVANGNLQKFRLGLVPTRNVEIIPVGRAMSIGEPTQPPQLNGRRDAACLDRAVGWTPRATRRCSINLRDGESRWQRQLGVVPTMPPIPQGEGVSLVAEDGGMVQVPFKSGAARDITSPRRRSGCLRRLLRMQPGRRSWLSRPMGSRSSRSRE